MTRTHGVTHFDPEGCFGCKAMTVDFQYPYGQKAFHGPTIKERLEREWKWADKAAADGNHFEPVPVRSQNF